jgi:hypothetical protein
MNPQSERELADLAARQWRVMAMAQLAALGFSYGAVEFRVAQGRLQRVHPGVYGVGHSNLPVPGRLWAAKLAAGDGAFFSHRTGAAEQRLRASHDLGRIELTVPGSWTPPRRAGLVVHRTTVPVDRWEARPYNDLLVATVPRLLVDLAAQERPGELLRLIRESVHAGQFDPHTLEAALERHRRRPGIAVLRGADARHRPGPDRKSELELSFQRAQRADPRVAVPEDNLTLLGWEIDVLWRDRGVCLELDGRPYHTVVEEFDRDHRKDRQLSVHGWRPARVSDFEWDYDQSGMLDDLYAILGV